MHNPSLTGAALDPHTKNFLYDATKGPWAEASSRFVSAAPGDIISLTPLASDQRTFAQVEIEGYLRSGNQGSFNGIPRDVVQFSYDAEFNRTGRAGAIAAITDMAAVTSAVNVASEIRITTEVDASGRTRLTGMDTGTLFEGRSGGIHTLAPEATPIRIAEEMFRPGADTTASFERGGALLTEGVSAMRVVTVGGQVAAGVGNVLGAYTLYEAGREAVAAVDAGDLGAAQRIMTDWTARTEGALVTGTAAMAVSAQALSPLLAGGPVGGAAYVVGNLAVGAVGAVVGDAGAQAFLHILRGDAARYGDVAGLKTTDGDVLGYSPYGDVPSAPVASPGVPTSPPGNLSDNYNFTDSAGGGRGNINPPAVAAPPSAYNPATVLPTYSGDNAITVQPGDTVSAIAARYNMTLPEYGNYLKGVYGPNADLDSIAAGAKLPIPQDVYDRTVGAINGLDLPRGTEPATQFAPAPSAQPTPDFGNEDVRVLLGGPLPVAGPGVQVAELGAAGIGFVPPVAASSPSPTATSGSYSLNAVNSLDAQSDAARAAISLTTTMANSRPLFQLDDGVGTTPLTQLHIDVVNSSPTAVALFEWAAENNIPVVVRPGQGTFFSSESTGIAPNGTVVIDAADFASTARHTTMEQDTVAAAVSAIARVVHEVAHAQDSLDGTPLLHPKDFASPSAYATARAQSEGNSLSTEGRFDAEIQGQRYTPPGSTTAVTITPDTYIVGTGRVGGTYLGDAVDGAFDRRLNDIYNDPTLSPEAKATLAASEGTGHNLNQVASTSNTTYLDQGLVDYAAYWSGVPAGQITGVQIDDNGQTWSVSTRAGVTEVTVNYGHIDTARPAGTGSAQAVSRVETTMDDDGNRMVTVVDYGRGLQSTTTYGPTGTVVGQALTLIGTTEQAPPVQTAGPAEAPAPAPPVSPMEPNIPAVPAPAPTFTTIRVNTNTTFLLNGDGDIVSETVTGLGGYTNTRSNTGERNYTDADGNAITGEQYEQYQTDRAAADKGAADITDYVAFVNVMAGLRNWDDMSDIQRLSALTGLVSQANVLSQGELAGSLGISSSALQATGSALGFLAAAERGDTAGMILNGGSFADAVGDKVFSRAIGSALEIDPAGVLPGLNMIMAAARGDVMGAMTGAMSSILAVNAIPLAGQVFAAFMLVGSFLMGKDEPPQQHGNAQAQWGDQGELDYGLQYNEGGGGKTAEKYASALMQGLQEAVAKQPELAIIPERAPRVGWVLEPGQDNLDRVYLEWEDARGQRHTRWYTEEGQPQPNRHGEAAGVKDIASDFLEIALSQGAIAPAAEVAELRQNWIEAMAPVVALEAQIAELDKLAEPVRPFQRMEGQQGLIWYDSVNPLRLAELEGQMAPLQQQADELRAKAKAQFDAELSGIEGVGTGDRPQTEVELQFIKEVLADGSGTLHITRDGKGGEVRWLEANNTREFDGKEGHTHGGVRDPNVATEKTIEAGDEDLQSTTNKTIASTTVQTRTTVGVGDARVADGEDGQVVSGQDGTQQIAAGPGGSAVISQTLAAVAQENATEPAEPAEDRTTVTVGEEIGAPSDAVTQPAHTVQETNTVAQGQDATQQAEGEAVQHDGAAGTVLEGQADASHEAVDAESGDVVSNEGVASAPAPSDTITVKSGDSRITSTTAAPAPRPASPAPVAFVPVQPATQEQERRQAVAAMVNSAQAANPMGGDAALAGLAAVGIAASGAHMGAQAQPIVAQQVAQAAQAELETQAAQAESSTGQAPAPATPAVNPGTQLTANPDGPAQPLQLTQVNLGSYQVANVSTQPAATAPAVPAEPVQPGIRAEVTVQWQGSAAAPIAPAPAPTSAPTVAAPIAPPTVLQSAVFADQPLGGAPAPAPAPAVVPAPVPDITSGAGGDTPAMPPPPVPATPLPIAPLAQQPFVWSDAPLLSLTVWGGAEDTGLLFTPDMLAPSRPGEGEMTLTAVGNVIGGEVALVDGLIVFRPDPHFNGEASFSYTVRNAWGFSSTGTAQLLVEAVNDAPVAQADSLATDEDRVLWLDAAGLLANDRDVDDDHATLRIAAVGAASGGTASLHDQADGSQRVSFTPDANFHGTASFEYTVIDPQGATTTATAQVQVAAINDAPVVQGDAADTDEDTAIIFTQAQLLANDSDVDSTTDGQVLTVTAVTGASHGSVSLLANGDVRFVPDAHYHGPAGFSYTVSDGAGGMADASVSLTVLAVNDTPMVVGESAAATEDTTLVIAASTLIANDSDADTATDAQILSISAVDGATHGTVSLVTLGDGSQQVHYTPNAHYHGPARFSYTVSDGAGGTATAIATLNVQAVNDLPVAQGETASLDEDNAITFTQAQLLANDSDADGATDGQVLSITAVAGAQHGSVHLLPNGDVRFVPHANYHGPARFSYTVSDGAGGTADASVSLTVLSVNDTPAAVGESASTAEDTTLVIAAGTLLANDSDADTATDGQILSISAVDGATHGSVSLVTLGDGSQQVHYTPDAHYHGPARFSYTVSDGAGGTATAIATLNVQAVNDLPVAQGETASLDEDNAITFTQAQLLANDSDADGGTDGQVLSVTAVAGATHGSVTLLANGDVRFVPHANYHGPAQFSYTVNDGAGGTADAVINLSVLSVNDTPVAVGDLLALPEDTAATITAADLLGNDTDADAATDGDVLTLTRVFDAQHCTVLLNADGTVSFTPQPNYHGNARFSYEITDAQGAASTAVAVVGVNAVNDAPVAQADSTTIQEDQRIVLDAAALLANDSDDDVATDGDSIRVASVGNATGGTVRLLAGGQIEFTPDAHFHGVAGFDYVAADTFGATSTARMTLNVTAVNDLPVAQGETASLDEDNAITFTQAQLLANDSDADGATDGQVLSITAVAGALHGSVSLLPNGDVRFVPHANYHGPAQFSYTVSDGAGGTADASVSLTVLAVNDTPVALGESATTAEDTTLVIAAAALLANDSDADAATDAQILSISAVDGATHGSVSLVTLGDGSQQVRYTPDAHYHGPAQFRYTVSDGAGGTATAMATLTVTPVNDLPVAQGESASLDEDNAITFTQAQLLANDSDADGATDGQVLSITAVAGAQHGSVSILPNGDIRFVPDVDYHGPAQFSYTVSDGAGGTADASVSLTVLSVNDTPVAVGESASTAEDTTLVIAAGTLLDNDSDADTATDGQILSISAVDGATHGSVSLVTLGDGSQQVRYTPDANYHGPAQFRYTVSDGAGGTATAMATLTVTPVNDLPVVQGEAATTQEDTALSWTAAALLANDTDADAATDGQTLTLQGVQNAQHGVVTLAANGTVTFTPDANYHGAASFQYVVTDGAGGTATGSVTVNVTTVNDLPVAQGEAASLSEDNAVIFTQAQLLANDSDTDVATDGQVLSITAVAGAQHGTVSLLANGDIRFVPHADYHGTAGFTYTVSDGAGGTADAGVSLTVLSVNDAPVVLGETASSLEDRVVQIDAASLLANDTDVDDPHASLRITAVGAAQGGTVALQALPDGAQRIEFVPTANWHGTATFSYTVTDPQGASSVATAVIQIAPENDAPVAVGETSSTQEDTGLLFSAASLLANDTDVDTAVDGDTLHIASVGNAQGGTAWLQADGSVRFQPDANYHGPAAFSYTVQDAAGAQATATVSLTVLPVNDLPQLTGEVVNSDEDVVLLIAPALLLANDTDVEPGTLQLTSVSAAVHGTVALVNGLDGQPQIEFTPEPNYHGAASFEYEVTDADGGTSRATVVLNLAPINDAPVAQADALSGTEDTAVVIALTQLTGNDTDVDGDALTVTAVGAATGGTVQLEAGAVRFTPQPDYFGPASFVYTVQDGRGGQAQALATLQIAPVNDAPVVGGEAIAGVEDTALVIAAQALLANDHDIDSANLAVTAVGNAQGGTVTLQADGSIRFDPLADHTGAAGFDYTVSDGDGGHTVASVVVQLAAVNDAPRLLGETIAATEDTPLSIDAAALLANDTDVDGAHTDLRITAVGNAAHGSVSLTGDGRILFTPDADYAGTAGFDYTVADAQGATSTVRATLQVAPVNDAPRLVGETVNADEDTVVRLTAAQLLGNDQDVDGDTLAIASVGGATHGSVALQADGSIVFTPTLNYNGAAAFTYTVSDGAGGLSQATVNLNLAAVNDAPSLQVDHLSTAENQPVTVSAASLLANDADVDGPHGALQVAAVGNAQHGSVSLANGQVTFTPDADYFGPAAFDYTVTDAGGGQATATAHVNVQWVNRAPVAVTDTLATQNEDTNVLILAGALLANDSDGDSARGAADSLRIHSVAALAGQTHGTVSLTAEGNVLFVPDADYVGPVNFSYVVSDAAGLQSSATAGFALANVNDAPTVVGEVITAKNQAQVWIDPATLLANDSDRDSIHAPQDLRVVAVDGATNGSVALQGDGRILFTPTAPGAGSFTYTVQDASGATAQGTAQVNTGNAAPVAVGESTTLAEDQVRTFSQAELLANDTDADNAPGDLHITAVGGATGGSVVLNAQGQVVFTPTLNHTGAAGFSYTVADGDGGTSQASVNLNYTPVNDAPVAVGEVLSFNEDQVASINTATLLANDSDVDGPGALSVGNISNVSGGTAQLLGSHVVFTPWSNFNGYAGFDYTVSDGAGGTSQARADVYFNPVNDVPVVNNEFYSGYQDAARLFTQGSLLANDTDVETPGQLTIINAYGGVNGTAQMFGNDVLFTPTPGYVGQASFQYTLADPHGGVGYGTTTINLARVNRSPVAVDDSFSTQEDLATNISHAQLLANDSDDGGAGNLRVSWVGNAHGGTITGHSGSAVFSPAHNFYGTASFQYEVTDADGARTNAMAYINVAPVNDAPVAGANYFTAPANAPYLIHASTLLANDSDPDGDGLFLAGIAGAQNGSLAWNVYQQSFWFTPYYVNGTASFYYAVSDTAGAQAHANVHFTVLPPADSGGGVYPIALDMDGDGVELVSAAASLTFADVDADGVAEQLGWVSPDDAVLAYDADDNGQINIATETTFVQYLPGAQTDLEGLAAFDTDGDGLLTAADAEWARFGALQDANASGRQDAGEFQSLDALGIQSISLTRQGTPTVVEGNTVFGTAAVMHTDGRVTEAADVMFAVLEVPVEVEVEVDETAHFNNLAQSFNEMCAAVAAEPAAGEQVLAAAPLAELSLAPPDTAAVIAPLIEAANAGTMTVTATG